VTASTAHPATAPVIEALRALGSYRPASARELADVLKSVHDTTGENVIDALATALRKLANMTYTSGLGSSEAQRYDIAMHLHNAADKLSAAGADEIDRARATTGVYHGTY
jgi:hypothetical protein